MCAKHFHMRTGMTSSENRNKDPRFRQPNHSTMCKIATFFINIKVPTKYKHFFSERTMISVILASVLGRLYY